MIKSIYVQNRAVYTVNDGVLIHPLPIELETFTSKTANSVLIIDRNTWESLPESLRPLPNCITVVVDSTLSSDNGGNIFPNSITVVTDPTVASDVGVSVFPTLKEALESFDTDENIWITGRIGILQEAMEYVDEVHLSIVADDATGNIKAPIVPGKFGLQHITVVKDGDRIVSYNNFSS